MRTDQEEGIFQIGYRSAVNDVQAFYARRYRIRDVLLGVLIGAIIVGATWALI